MLVSGLNLVVGYAGMLAVGYVGMLAVGAYTASMLSTSRVDPLVGLAAAGVAGVVAGVIVGLAGLRLKLLFRDDDARLRHHRDPSRAGLGRAHRRRCRSRAPVYRARSRAAQVLCLVLAVAAVATWLVWNIASGNPGRALIAVRDAEVAAEAVGMPITRLKLSVFALSGALGGLAGALFATVQSYITPDAFTLDLSVLFFIAVLIGGRGRVVGPMLGTVLLTLLPEFAAPLVTWSSFVYASLLLVVVLVAPGGIAELIERLKPPPPQIDRMGAPNPGRWAAIGGLPEPAPRRSCLSG